MPHHLPKDETLTTRTNTPTTGRASLLRARWAAIGAAVAVTVGAGGLMTAKAAADSQGDAAAFVSVTPCRLVDTRSGASNVGPRSTPLSADATYTAAATGTNGNCTLPADAETLVMNVTVVDQTAASFLTVFEAGTARPHTSSLNWEAAGVTANAVTVNVSESGELSFYNLNGSAQLVVDVVGYYTTAPFDEFYTKAEVDDLIAANPSGVGEVGPKGDTGDTGAAGTTGAQGATGETGATGAIGPKGDTGAAGPQGPVGDTGAVGPKGDTGDTGAVGPKGDTGDTGAVGPKGDTGDSVLDGLACTTNQTIRWNGIAWECHGTTTTVDVLLGRHGYEPWGPSIRDTFSYYTSNMSANEMWACDDIRCEIHIDDVPDERNCVVTYHGTNVEPTYETFESMIFVYDLWLLGGAPFEVNVSCTW